MGRKKRMTMIEAIREYQEPGAATGFDPATATIDRGWAEHVPGTIISNIGIVLLGMPKGFNRIGPVGLTIRTLFIFETWEQCQSWPYHKFNVPVWKHLDSHGNTLVRGLSPRTNQPFIHVILGDHLDKISCLEITEADLKEMD
jgi:hypothetical protein